MQPLLEAENIGKTFLTPHPLTILNGISLRLMPKEKIAIIGKSGEGKSTLLHILGTIEKPSSGILKIKGQDALSSLAGSTNCLRNQTLGFIFQAFHLLNDLSVIENVLLPMKIARKQTQHGSEAYNYAMMLLQKVGLRDRAYFACKKLSGGEKQRVAIARAFANNPDIILADEPTGNLDHKNALEVQRLLFEFTKEQEKSLILVTHNETLARQCDRCYILENSVLTLYPLA